eukprot:2288252-Amphidinium_carterae.1
MHPTVVQCPVNGCGLRVSSLKTILKWHNKFGTLHLHIIRVNPPCTTAPSHRAARPTEQTLFLMAPLELGPKDA